MLTICSSADDSIGIGAILAFTPTQIKVFKDDGGYLVINLATGEAFRCYDVTTISINVNLVGPEQAMTGWTAAKLS